MGSVIVVAGESLIDRIIRSDRASVDVPGGGPFNVARALARLGVRVAFVGRISTDEHGRTLRAALLADGVDLGMSIETDAPTLLADATLDADGTARYRFTPDASAAAGLAATDLPEALPPTTSALHVGSLGLVLEPLAGAIEALVAAAAADILVFVDLNIRPVAITDALTFRARLARLLRRVDVVKASTEDLAWLAPGTDSVLAAQGLIGGGPAVVLVTDGPRPVRVVTETEAMAVDVPTVSVVDTVGAGDAFGAGFLAAWTGAGRGRVELADLEAVVEATRFAVEVGTRAVMRAGADPPTLVELGESARRW
jgi:fructokinase